MIMDDTCVGLEDVNKLIRCFKKRADLIDRFLTEYPKWESQREAAISSLESLAADLERFAKDTEEAKGASSGGITGSVIDRVAAIGDGLAAIVAGVDIHRVAAIGGLAAIIVAGVVLVPVTGGCSSGLAGVGAAALVGKGAGTIGAAGAITAAGAIGAAAGAIGAADPIHAAGPIHAAAGAIRRLRTHEVTLPKLKDYGVTETRCNDVYSNLKNDAHSTRQLTAILSEIHELYEEINAILDKIRAGKESQTVQLLHAAAQFCNTRIKRGLFAAFYSVTSRSLQWSDSEFDNFKPTWFTDVKGMPCMTEELKKVAKEQMETMEIELMETKEMKYSSNQAHDEVAKLMNSSQDASGLREQNRALRARVKEWIAIYLHMKNMVRQIVIFNQDEEQQTECFLIAVVSVATYNIRGTVQNGLYKEFLQAVFQHLNQDLYCLQECIWCDGSNIWSAILPGHSVSVSNSKEAGLATRQVFLQQQPLVTFQVDYDFMRRCETIVTVNFTYKVTLINGVPQFEQSSERMQFLAFSYHGFHKITRDEKRAKIIAFFNYVGGCCDHVQLPAVVGGDFNLDVMDGDYIKNQANCDLVFYGGYSTEFSSNDFICLVNKSRYPTKIEIFPKIYYFESSDYRKYANPTIQDKLPNHVPYYADIVLTKKLP